MVVFPAASVAVIVKRLKPDVLVSSALPLATSPVHVAASPHEYAAKAARPNS